MRKYFYTDGTSIFGPFSKEELKSKSILHNTKIWYYGLEKWTCASEISELNDVIISLEDKKQEVSDSFEDKLANSKKPKNKVFLFFQILIKSKIIKYFAAGLIIILVIIFTLKFIEKQETTNLYNQIVNNSFYGDEDFEFYVEKFYRDLEYYGILPPRPKKTIIKFSKLDQFNLTTHIHALSLGYDDDERIEIYINPSSWKKFTKPMRYFLMYHELCHDVLNLRDLDANQTNYGKLMYPEISAYEKKTMDDFIESFHALFEELSKKR